MYKGENTSFSASCRNICTLCSGQLLESKHELYYNNACNLSMVDYMTHIVSNITGILVVAVRFFIIGYQAEENTTLI